MALSHLVSEILYHPDKKLKHILVSGYGPKAFVYAVSLKSFISKFFYMDVWHESRWCRQIEVLTQPEPGKNPILFYQRSDFHMTDNVSLAVHAFAWCMLTLLSVDEILLPRCVNRFTSFSGDGSFLIKNHELYFIHFHIEANVSSCFR